MTDCQTGNLTTFQGIAFFEGTPILWNAPFVYQRFWSFTNLYWDPRSSLPRNDGHLYQKTNPDKINHLFWVSLKSVTCVVWAAERNYVHPGNRCLNILNISMKVSNYSRVTRCPAWLGLSAASWFSWQIVEPVILGLLGGLSWISWFRTWRTDGFMVDKSILSWILDGATNQFTTGPRGLPAPLIILGWLNTELRIMVTK